MGSGRPFFLTTTVRPATALGGEEGLTGLPLRSRAQHLVCNSPGSACTGGNDSQLSMGIPWTHRRWRRVPEKKGWHVLTHDPMPKGSATPRIALMNNNREAERALRGGLQWSTQPCIEFGIRRRESLNPGTSRTPSSAACVCVSVFVGTCEDKCGSGGSSSHSFQAVADG